MHKKDDSPWLGLARHYHPPGTSPGTLVDHHPASSGEVTITMIQYAKDYHTEKTMEYLEQCWEEGKSDCITWINIAGDYSPDMLTVLGEHYGFHALSMEDVLNVGQHPKMERYDDYYFLIMYLLSGAGEVDAHQVSIFWSPKFIITMEPEEEGAFEILRTRIRNPKTKLREMGTDYLCYCIVDALVDRFFPRLEELKEQLDLLEERIFSQQEKAVIEKIHNIKIKLLILSKLVWASQELVAAMQNEEADLTSPNIDFYLRDCYDHTVQLAHNIDSYREISSGIIDSYLSLISNQQNQVIKVLTIIATIFIPLTFIVGVYGMNFRTEAGPLSMPELNWAYGYVGIWGFMILLSMTMIYYFRRRKWL